MTMYIVPLKIYLLNLFIAFKLYKPVLFIQQIFMICVYNIHYIVFFNSIFYFAQGLGICFFYMCMFKYAKKSPRLIKQSIKSLCYVHCVEHRFDS